MLRYLLRPFAYLGIQHQSRTMALLNWVLPMVVAVALVGLMMWVLPRINLYGPDGLFVRLLGFVQSLPGFYIAALAAVATFNQSDLDKIMPGKPPTARIIYNGQSTVVELTRRRFLCLMFSYLTAISFLLTLGLVATTTVAAALREVIPVDWRQLVDVPARWGVCWLLLTATMQMLVVTFYGLFYIGERMHTPDA